MVIKQPRTARTAIALLERNDLLAALHQDDRARWLGKLEPVRLAAGAVLQQPGIAWLTHAYFPVSAVCSVLWLTRGGASTQTAIVGKEGMLDVSLCLGGESMPARLIVQQAGLALRVPDSWIVNEFNSSMHVRRILLRYAQAVMVEAAQAAACNRRHTIHQQLCRWLLLSLDRSGGAELTTTQELIAGMLGVRREGVNEAAGRLQREGMIAYRRGRIAVLDRGGLERSSCECYAQVTGEFRRLLATARTEQASSGSTQDLRIPVRPEPGRAGLP